MDVAVITAITGASDDLVAAAPGVIVAGLAIAVIWWGAPKLFKLLKRTSN